jgi:hypothetical protein
MEVLYYENPLQIITCFCIIGETSIMFLEIIGE